MTDEKLAEAVEKKLRAQAELMDAAGAGRI